MYKIALVLTSRFPSEKAYAVTTLETAKAAQSMGVSVKIYAPSNSADETMTNLINIENIAIRKLSQFLGRAPGKLGVFVFFLRRILISVEFQKILRAANSLNTIVWTRDPIVAILTNSRSRVFLEIHNIPSRVDGYIYKLLKYKRGFSVGTLTDKHQIQLQKYFPEKKIKILPMAVSSSFFHSRRSELTREKIGYIGKGWSSGEDNKLYELIHSAKLVDKELENPIQWEFLGLEPNYKSKMESVVGSYSWLKSEFIFINHVSHDKVPNYLGRMSIGLIPYYDSAYNRQRFPIKSLEYAAARVTILATDTPGNQSLLSSDFCYFYAPEESISLAKAILSILNDKKERNQRIESAQRWASRHTYEARVKKVLESFHIPKEGKSNI